MSELVFRRYVDADFAGCVAIFHSNYPRYFGPQELEELEQFLAPPVDDYWVIERDDVVVASGGVGRHGEIADLRWGMVLGSEHGNDLGTMLVHERLAVLRTDPAITRVEIETSQHTQGFYARFGFVETNVVTDGFGPGIDQVSMSLDL